MPSHDLDDHDAFMAFGGRVDLVDRVRRRGNGGVEPERRHGPADVVVDGLRHANDRQSLLQQRVRDPERAVAADRNERVEAVRAERVEQLLRAIALDPRSVRLLVAPFQGIAAIRRAEDRAAEVGGAADLVGTERDELALAKQSAEPAREAETSPPPIPRSERGGPYDGVQARRAPA